VRTGIHDPDHRVLSQPYVVVFLVSTFLFAGSVVVPAPWRFWMWGAGLLLLLLLPLIMFSMGKRNPHAQAQLSNSRNVTPSLVERFGLFTIIVLGV
jgi:low temperature requirement protein LtrA